MPENDPDNWKSAAAGIGAVLLGAWAWVWSRLHRTLDGKVDKEAFNKLEKTVADHSITKEEFKAHAKSDERLFEQLIEEGKLHRETAAKIFDQMRDMEKTSNNQFSSLLGAINGGKKE